MIQAEKDILLKDLCARLPYKVKAKISDEYGGYTSAIESIDIDGFVGDFEGEQTEIENIKPYLFPLSSMTEEQKREYNSLRDFVPTYHYEWGDIVEDTELYDNWGSIDYLIANHFDYRGLIPKGLAVDATGKGIY